jgi:hypothetical protein
VNFALTLILVLAITNLLSCCCITNYTTDVTPTESEMFVLLFCKVFSLLLPAHAGSSLADFSTLKMEAICSSEKWVHFTASTRRHISEDGILLSYISLIFQLWPFSKNSGYGVSNAWFAPPSQHVFVFTLHCCDSEGKQHFIQFPVWLLEMAAYTELYFCHVTHTLKWHLTRHFSEPIVWVHIVRFTSYFYGN